MTRKSRKASAKSSPPPPRSEPAVGLLLDAAREAERVLEQEGRNHPMYADVRHRLGLLRLLRRDPHGGEREFEEALGINPGYRAAYYGLRLARMIQGLKVEELRSTDAQTATQPQELAWRRMDEAYQLLAGGGDPTQVLGPSEDLTEELLGHHYAGFFHFQAGQHARAQERFEAAARTSPLSCSALERLGVLPWTDADHERTTDGLDSLLWSPLAGDLYAYLARVYARNGLKDEALECCERAYIVLPQDAQNAMYRAEIAIAFGDEQEPIRLLAQAVEADPTCVPARIALGYENASQGCLEEARAQFRVAANLAPGYADVRYSLALLHVGEGRLQDALEEFRKALSLNPSYLPARHSMSHLLCRMGQYEEGLREYAKIRSHGFESADMLVQMGKAALALGMEKEALQYLERAVFLNPDFAACYYYLGQAYQHKGLKKRARSAWRTYLEKANEWEPREPVPPGCDAERAA